MGISSARVGQYKNRGPGKTNGLQTRLYLGGTPPSAGHVAVRGGKQVFGNSNSQECHQNRAVPSDFLEEGRSSRVKIIATEMMHPRRRTGDKIRQSKAPFRQAPIVSKIQRS